METSAIMSDTAAIYLAYDQAALDQQYNNRARFPTISTTSMPGGHGARRRAAETRHVADLAFGPSPMEKIDVFPAARKGAPLYVFIHAATGILSTRGLQLRPDGLLPPHGVTTVVNNFGLAPTHDMDRSSARPGALAWIWRHAATTMRMRTRSTSRVTPRAGTLLRCCWRGLARIRAGVAARSRQRGRAIGGIFDLEPIRLFFLTDAASDAGAGRAPQPAAPGYPVRAPLLLVVAADESTKFHAVREMETAWKRIGYPVDHVVPDKPRSFRCRNHCGDPSCHARRYAARSYAIVVWRLRRAGQRCARQKWSA